MIRKEFVFVKLDPIWLIASVEEGGLMGITQQLEQCHSLGMNMDQTSTNNLICQTSPTNPFQTTRWPGPDANNVPAWTNYPLVPVTVSVNEE